MSMARNIGKDTTPQAQTMLDHALAYAADGLAVFPCREDDKPPACENGVHDATIDPARIKELWKGNPNYNIGFDPSSKGLAVLDVDGEAGAASLFELELEQGSLPATRTHKTPRGGFHYIFSDPDGTWTNSASKLGPNLDTRANGGYILLPPSRFQGKPYTLVSDVAPAPAPLFIATRLGEKREHIAAPDGIELDQPQNAARANALLFNYTKAGHVAIEGQGGDTLTYQVAAEVLNLGLSAEATLEAMLPWNEACQPPWEIEELRVKIENAAQYAQNEAGCYGVRPISDRIPKEALSKLIAESAATVPGIEEDAPTQTQYPSPRHARALRNSPGPLPWFLVDGLILGGHVNILSGDGGTGKTTLAELLAAAAAAGIPSLDKQTRQMPVVLVQMEDGPGVTILRMDKICAALETQADSLPIDYWCLAGHDATIATVSDNGDWTPRPFLQVLEKQLASYGKPVFLILDNVADIVVLDETKRGAVNTFVKKILGGLCERYGTTILLIAHPSKAAMQDGSDYAGSTAWKNGVRQMLSLSWPNDERNGNRRILKVVKSNYSKTQEIELTLLDGVFYTRAQEAPAEHDARLMDACVDAALMAAEQGTPIQGQKRPPKWVFDEVERRVGRRPTVRELREVLNYASLAGRVRYLKGTTKRMAGYYPWDQERAAELAAEAKRHNAAVETLSKRERADA